MHDVLSAPVYILAMAADNPNHDITATGRPAAEETDPPAASADRASRQQADILEASERLVAAHSLDDVIDVLRKTARAAVGAEGIAIALKDGDRCFYVAEDAVAPLWQGQSFPASDCIFGWAMRERETVAIRDVRLDPRVPQEAYARTFVRSLVMVPIGRPDPVAAIGAYWSAPADHDADTVARLESLARLATIAIENARLAHARDRAENELRESEERLRLAVDNADVGFWDVDVINNRLIWPPRTKAMFGISADVPVTMDDFYNGLHPGDRAVTTAAYLAATDPSVRADYDVEYRTVGKEDGVVRWVAAKGRGVFDRSGQCLRVAGTALDITTHKASDLRRSALGELGLAIRDQADPAEIAYAASKVLGETLGMARVGYAAIDHDAETLHVDRDWTAPGVETLAGTLSLRDYGSFIDSLKRGEFTVIGDVRADDRTSGAAAKAIESKSTRSFVNAPILEHGRLAAVFFVNHSEARTWSDGELALIREFAERTRNAVERARGQFALRDSEARLRELNETLAAQVEARSAERDRLWNLSQDMLARADYTGMMSAVSPAWTQVLGWSEEELLRRGYATFMHPDDAPPTLEAIGRMADTRLPTRFENRISTHDGQWKPIEWTVAPEPDGLNFIAVGRDLSHVKEREAELEKAQEALRQSQKMEAMGSLTGGVAHDFNNLLTPIIGSLDMLVRKNVGSERERRLIDGALQSAERAKTLVQRLLAFARRQPLQPAAVDVSQLITSMIGLLESTLGPTIDVRVDLSPELPPANADINQLEMALLNLAVNARDAMPDGGELTIVARRDSVRGPHPSGVKPGHYVRLCVADTGSGMDEETVKRATEPFYSTKGVGKGTGLGLSMVHGLAAQLGGGLAIESAPGEGTVIELWLPISIGSVGIEDSETSAIPAIVTRGTALLIDDEELVRMSTADMLIDLGYEVTEAISAEEALDLLRAGLEPDLVVTDHLMPGMSGAELARKLKDERPKMPVLIVSGYAEAEGVDADIPRLTKPFRNAELAETIAGLVTSGGR